MHFLVFITLMYSTQITLTKTIGRLSLGSLGRYSKHHTNVTAPSKCHCFSTCGHLSPSFHFFSDPIELLFLPANYTTTTRARNTSVSVF